MQEFSALPKVDLNLDLLMGAHSAVIKDLAWHVKDDISGIFAEDGGYRFGDYDFFWRLYGAAASVVRGPQAYQRLILSALEQSAKAGVVYTEIRLSPKTCGADLGAWCEILAAAEEVAAQGLRDYGVHMRLIATLARQDGPDQARKSALLAAETAGNLLVGLALAGDARVLEPKDYAWALDCAREAGLKIVADCAIEATPIALKSLLTQARPDRIGHGAGVIADLALVDEFAERGVMLDLCPASDVAFGKYGEYRTHSIGELDRRGLKLAIASEYPAFLRSSMATVYGQIHRAFDWDESQFRRIAQQSLAAAFCDQDMKIKIAKMLEA